jgi:septation ring formation regulator EzrA
MMCPICQRLLPDNSDCPCHKDDLKDCYNNLWLSFNKVWAERDQLKEELEKIKNTKRIVIHGGGGDVVVLPATRASNSEKELEEAKKGNTGLRHQLCEVKRECYEYRTALSATEWERDQFREQRNQLKAELAQGRENQAHIKNELNQTRTELNTAIGCWKQHLDHFNKTNNCILAPLAWEWDLEVRHAAWENITGAGDKDEEDNDD